MTITANKKSGDKYLTVGANGVFLLKMVEHVIFKPSSGNFAVYLKDGNLLVVNSAGCTDPQKEIKRINAILNGKACNGKACNGKKQNKNGVAATAGVSNGEKQNKNRVAASPVARSFPSPSFRRFTLRDNVTGGHTNFVPIPEFSTCAKSTDPKFVPVCRSMGQEIECPTIDLTEKFDDANGVQKHRYTVVGINTEKVENGRVTGTYCRTITWNEFNDLMNEYSSLHGIEFEVIDFETGKRMTIVCDGRNGSCTPCRVTSQNSEKKKAVPTAPKNDPVTARKGTHAVFDIVTATTYDVNILVQDGPDWQKSSKTEVLGTSNPDKNAVGNVIDLSKDKTLNGYARYIVLGEWVRPIHMAYIATSQAEFNRMQKECPWLDGVKFDVREADGRLMTQVLRTQAETTTATTSTTTNTTTTASNTTTNTNGNSFNPAGAKYSQEAQKWWEENLTKQRNTSKYEVVDSHLPEAFQKWFDEGLVALKGEAVAKTRQVQSTMETQQYWDSLEFPELADDEKIDMDFMRSITGNDTVSVRKVHSLELESCWSRNEADYKYVVIDGGDKLVMYLTLDEKGNVYPDHDSKEWLPSNIRDERFTVVGVVTLGDDYKEQFFCIAPLSKWPGIIFNGGNISIGGLDFAEGVQVEKRRTGLEGLKDFSKQMAKKYPKTDGVCGEIRGLASRTHYRESPLYVDIEFMKRAISEIDRQLRSILETSAIQNMDHDDASSVCENISEYVKAMTRMTSALGNIAYSLDAEKSRIHLGSSTAQILVNAMDTCGLVYSVFINDCTNWSPEVRVKIGFVMVTVMSGREEIAGTMTNLLVDMSLDDATGDGTFLELLNDLFADAISFVDDLMATNKVYDENKDDQASWINLAETSGLNKAVAKIQAETIDTCSWSLHEIFAHADVANENSPNFGYFDYEGHGEQEDEDFSDIFVERTLTNFEDLFATACTDYREAKAGAFKFDRRTVKSTLKALAAMTNHNERALDQIAEHEELLCHIIGLVDDVEHSLRAIRIIGNISSSETESVIDTILNLGVLSTLEQYLTTSTTGSGGDGGDDGCFFDMYGSSIDDKKMVKEVAWTVSNIVTVRKHILRVIDESDILSLISIIGHNLAEQNDPEDFKVPPQGGNDPSFELNCEILQECVMTIANVVNSVAAKSRGRDLETDEQSIIDHVIDDLDAFEFFFSSANSYMRRKFENQALKAMILLYSYDEEYFQEDIERLGVRTFLNLPYVSAPKSKDKDAVTQSELAELFLLLIKNPIEIVPGDVARMNSLKTKYNLNLVTRI